MASGPSTRRLPLPPPSPQPLSADHPRCPRCTSQDTKFCYYNNYNLAQPRHFCKSCRRYWTLGGSLRNIPIGGTSRRNTSTTYSHNTPKRRRYSISTTSSPVSSQQVAERNVNTAQDVSQANPTITSRYDAEMARTFGALLMEPLPTGFLAFGDALAPGPSYGLRLRNGIEGVGFGQLGRTTLWPFFGEELDPSGSSVATSENRFCVDTWPVSNGGGGDINNVGVVNNGCFAWPDLAISITPGKRMG